MAFATDTASTGEVVQVALKMLTAAPTQHSWASLQADADGGLANAVAFKVQYDGRKTALITLTNNVLPDLDNFITELKALYPENAIFRGVQLGVNNRFFAVYFDVIILGEATTAAAQLTDIAWTGTPDTFNGSEVGVSGTPGNYQGLKENEWGLYRNPVGIAQMYMCNEVRQHLTAAGGNYTGSYNDGHVEITRVTTTSSL